MTTTTATTSAEKRQSFTWRSLVGVAVASDLVLLLVHGVVRQDREALAVAGAMLLGAGLLRVRGGLAGLGLLGLSFANLELWMLPAAISNASHGGGLVGVLLPATLAAVSLAGLVASLAAIARRRAPAAGGNAAGRTGLVTVGAVAVALVVAAVVGPGPARPVPAGELVLDSSRTAFQPGTLTTPSRQVTVHLTNRDLFWHSFTIDRPAVNVDVPVGGTRQVTFTVAPGTYQFYCRVPGHKEAGMVGTLVVR
jgi:plastocyanin